MIIIQKPSLTHAGLEPFWTVLSKGAENTGAKSKEKNLSRFTAISHAHKRVRFLLVTLR